MVTHYHPGPKTVKKQNAITKIDFLKTRIVMKLIILGSFIVILALFYIWSRIQIVQVGYEINEMTHEQQLIKNEHRNLEMELLMMKAPQKIDGFARERLKMITPSQENIIEISWTE